jgi:quinol monooxygenase YgiN
MVRYQVKPDQVEENERLIRAVYAELHGAEPSGMRYATFRLPDGVSFVHLHSNERDDGINALTELPAFKQFVQGISERCEEQPVVSELSEIGSFRWFE